MHPSLRVRMIVFFGHRVRCSVRCGQQCTMLMAQKYVCVDFNASNVVRCFMARLSTQTLRGFILWTRSCQSFPAPATWLHLLNGSHTLQVIPIYLCGSQHGDIDANQCISLNAKGYYMHSARRAAGFMHWSLHFIQCCALFQVPSSRRPLCFLRFATWRDWGPYRHRHHR